MGTSRKTVAVSYVIDPLLTVTRRGTQKGTVTSSPSGISCGSTCSDYFPVDTNITLSSTLPSGYCVNWTGCTQNYALFSLNMGSANKSVTHAYQTNRKLYVTRTGTSKKTITSSPSGINCGTNCNEPYPQGTVVTLTSATPATGMHVEWTGCTVQSNPLQCVYTMDCTDHTVTANFANNHTLTVTKSPSAGGTVTSSPSGINCGATCSAAYGDTLVTLTATPASGYYVASWSGCGSTNGNVCYVTVNANKTVTATFAQLAQVTISKIGSGTVTGTDVNCGSDCVSEGIPGNQVTLTASPATGYVFSEWVGCASHSHANGTCVGTYPLTGGGNGYVYPFFAPNSSSTRNLTLVVNAPTDPSCGGTYGVEGGTQYSYYYGSNPSPTAFSATQVVKISRDTSNCGVIPTFSGCDVVVNPYVYPFYLDCYVLMSSDRTVTTGSN